MKKKKKSQDWVGKKIGILENEGYPRKQSIAIALEMAGRSNKHRKKRK